MSASPAIVAAQDTDTIVTSFELTDALLASGLTPTDYMIVCETRGWMIDELLRRGQGALIGLDSEGSVATLEP